MLYPFKLQPIYKEKIWGGQRLHTVLHKEIPEDEPTGESWEIADHEEDTNIIVNGKFQGRNLHHLFLESQEELLGKRLTEQYPDKFPLLIKFIDASDKLSIQVHPDDAYAQKHENGSSGKTEFWYIVDAQPDSYLIAGLARETTREEFAEAVKNNTLEELFNKVYVKSGDFIYIPAGRLHAIMPGILLNEIQQNSDITYRVYDWNRMGLDGKPRPLHIQQSLDVINFKDVHIEREKPIPLNDHTLLLKKSPFFTVEKLQFAQSITESTQKEDSFHALSVISGSAVIQAAEDKWNIQTGDSVLIPYSVGEYKIIPQGNTVMIKSFIGNYG